MGNLLFDVVVRLCTSIYLIGKFCKNKLTSASNRNSFDN